MTHSAEFEFNLRVNIQRQVIQSVNAHRVWSEELTGLGTEAVRRWAIANDIGADSPIVASLLAVSRTLGCLAVKSQEQVTEEYASLCRHVQDLQRQLVSLLAANH